MQNELHIREFGRILKDKENAQISVKKITLNPVDWDFLANHANSNLKDDRFIDIVNLTTLRVKNFVGVVTTPSGTQIEILPKIDNGNDINESRLTLEKMLKVVNDLPFIQTTEADLQLKNQPLPEVLISWFLRCVDKIVKQGIHKDYNRINAQEKFLKGQLQTHKQLNEAAHKQHLFHIEYDIFSMNRAENRLIHSALLQVLNWSKDNHNQKQAKHFLMLFDEVPLAKNYNNDFSKWSKSRDMNYYQPVLPWLKLILNQQSPFTLKDKNAGISFLLPMEKLFEKYVAKILSKKLSPKGFQVKIEPKKYLTTNPNAFLMKPDIAIYQGDKVVRILDTKWKLIDQSATYENGNNDNKKGISQSDVYQLFAYGKKYAVKKVVLIYPKWQKFEKGFGYKLDTDLRLKIKPFDVKENI